MNATPAFGDEISPLMQKIQSRIHTDGSIRFSDYMAMALYDPEFGYYAAGVKRVGKEGDFVTSVSIGRCFGMILAHRIFSFWKESENAPDQEKRPTKFHIIEPGAHDGSLCADILEAIQKLSPAFYETVHYHLIEATPALVTAQNTKLSEKFSGKFTSHDSLDDLEGLHGALLSNELIDAFPVDLIRSENGSWNQLCVELTAENSLTFSPHPIDPEQDPDLTQLCTMLGDKFSDNYTTEHNVGVGQFTHEASKALGSGLFITIDYGHSTEDYYHPDRTTGTLQTYFNHQKAEDPLDRPGEIDITCHIDFTRLITSAESDGFHSPSLRTQASYLTDHARTWLLDIENPETPTAADTPQLIRQFQSLIHPAMLGTKFTVLEMRK